MKIIILKNNIKTTVSYEDEYRASITASRCDKLSEEDREMLKQDALDKLTECCLCQDEINTIVNKYKQEDNIMQKLINDMGSEL